MSKSTINRILQEVNQGKDLRLPILKKISRHFEDRYVISFYTNFNSANSSIENPDAEMISNLLTGLRDVKSKKLLLIIDSPGGDPLAAERIVKICREYSDKDYWVVVPGMAKSAATMIVLGSEKIILAPISELGPIDIQISTGKKLQPAFAIIDAYDKLLEQGIKIKPDERIEPILQQLSGFDAAEIENLRQINELSSDIAVKILKSGMFKGKKIDEIRKSLKIFIDPKGSKTHGRPIYYSDIDKKGFNIEEVDINSDIWHLISEYHLRVKHQMQSGKCNKLIESIENTYTA